MFLYFLSSDCSQPIHNCFLTTFITLLDITVTIMRAHLIKIWYLMLCTANRSIIKKNNNRIIQGDHYQLFNNYKKKVYYLRFGNALKMECYNYGLSVLLCCNYIFLMEEFEKNLLWLKGYLSLWIAIRIFIFYGGNYG